MKKEYLNFCRQIADGQMPRPTLAIPEGAWERAQKAVAPTLKASNETYIHPNLLRGLIENVAVAISASFDLGHKAAGGTMLDAVANWNSIELALDREQIDALATLAEAMQGDGTLTHAGDQAVARFLETINIYRRKS